MESAFLLVVVTSTATGVVLRRWLGRAAGRRLLVAGAAAVIVTPLVLLLTLFGWWPFETLAAGLAMAGFLVVAGATLPMGAVLWSPRRQGRGRR
jgi:hypothetical protein